jgi:hypothetical protein
MEFIHDDGGAMAVWLTHTESEAWDQVPRLRDKLTVWITSHFRAQGWDDREIAVYYDDGMRGGTIRVEHRGLIPIGANLLVAKRLSSLYAA